MRTKKSLINLIVSLTIQLLNIVLQFGMRWVFIYFLKTEYLGLNGLFSNILNMLSFAELGFGSAITFSLYKPLAEGNELIVSGIMNFFKKIYFLVGIFILISGLMLSPFLSFFIKEIPDIAYIHLIFILWVINSSISYFWVYKATLIIADQKKYIVDQITFIVKMITIILQVILLFLYKNYILYLATQILGTFSSNICISHYANKQYKFLRVNKEQKIDKDSLIEIKKNVTATIMHKVGAVVIFSTDNILLSKFFGLLIVGIYSNYSLIISTVTNFAGQIQLSIVASVGNLGVNSSNEKKLEVFSKYYFINFWVFTWTASCLLCLLNPFIKLWLGNEYTISNFVVLIIISNYFLTGLRSAPATFNNAFGLFWNTKFLPIVESILNLCFSIIFAKIFGYYGIFLGTFISSILTGLWYEPYVLYKKGFDISPIHFIKIFSKYLSVAIFVIMISFVISSGISYNGLFGFICKIFTLILLPNVLIVCIFHKTEEFKFYFEMILDFVNKKIGRKKNASN